MIDKYYEMEFRYLHDYKHSDSAYTISTNNNLIMTRAIPAKHRGKLVQYIIIDIKIFTRCNNIILSKLKYIKIFTRCNNKFSIDTN